MKLFPLLCYFLAMPHRNLEAARAAFSESDEKMAAEISRRVHAASEDSAGGGLAEAGHEAASARTLKLNRLKRTANRGITTSVTAVVCVAPFASLLSNDAPSSPGARSIITGGAMCALVSFRNSRHLFFVARVSRVQACL